MNLNLKSKLIASVISITMIFSSSISAYAQVQNAVNDNYTYDVIKKYAETFMGKYKSSSNLNNPIELFNPNNEVAALFFSDKTGGYIIVNVDDESVPEFSPKNNNKYIIDKNTKYFYNGPITYMQENNGKIIDLKNNSEIGTLEQLKSKLNEKAIYGEAEKKKNLSTNLAESQSLNSAAVYNYSYTISGGVPIYAYNPNGICGSTAAAMYLRYYDYYKNDKYVPLSLSSSDGVNLIKYLVPYIDGSTPGSTPGEVQIGIKNYLSGQGVSASIYLSNFNIGTVAGLVSSNKPFVAGLSNDPTYGEHWVTGYGYAGNSSGDFIIVNDGWGGSNIYINTIYNDFMVY